MITINGKPLERDRVFSGGELDIKLPKLDIKSGELVTINYRSKDPNDIFKLGLIVNSIRNNYKYLNPYIALDICYLPYARQDRVCNFGETYGIEFIIYYLHFLKFSKIRVLDVHSPIAKKVSYNLLRKEQVGCLNPRSEFYFNDFINSSNFIEGLFKLGIDFTDLIRIAPDSGSVNRIKQLNFDLDSLYIESIPYYSFYKYYKTTPILEVSKERVDGKVIQEIKNFIPLTGLNNLLIIDDICDGGATYIDLAKYLKSFNPKSITLFVTHGIFRNGTDILYEAGIDRIITTDSLPQTITNHKGEFHVFNV